MKTAHLIAYNHGMEDIPLPTDKPAIIGRGKTCTKTIKSDSLSRKHAIFHYEKDNYYVTDLFSVNGTAVNQEFVEPNKPVELRDNDKVTLGGVRYKFKLGPHLNIQDIIEKTERESMESLPIYKKSSSIQNTAHKVPRNPFCSNNGTPSMSVDELLNRFDLLSCENESIKTKLNQFKRQVEMQQHLLQKKKKQVIRLFKFAKKNSKKMKDVKRKLNAVRQKRDHLQKLQKSLTSKLRSKKQEVKELQKQIKNLRAANASKEQISLSLNNERDSNTSELIKNGKRFNEILNEDLICCVCHEVFIDPHSITCGHTFCKFCINEWAKKNPMNEDCPICRKRMYSCHRSMVLASIVDKFLESQDTEVHATRDRLIEDRKKVCPDFTALDQLSERMSLEHDSFFNYQFDHYSDDLTSESDGFSDEESNLEMDSSFYVQDGLEFDLGEEDEDDDDDDDFGHEIDEEDSDTYIEISHLEEPFLHF